MGIFGNPVSILCLKEVQITVWKENYNLNVVGRSSTQTFRLIEIDFDMILRKEKIEFLFLL